MSSILCARLFISCPGKFQPRSRWCFKGTLSFLIVSFKSIHLRINQHVSLLCDIFSKHSDGCQIIPDTIYCFYVRLPYNCALWACYTTTIMIAFERCIATICLRNYYRNRTVGPLFVAVQVSSYSSLCSLSVGKSRGSANTFAKQHPRNVEELSFQ